MDLAFFTGLGGIAKTKEDGLENGSPLQGVQCPNVVVFLTNGFRPHAKPSPHPRTLGKSS